MSTTLLSEAARRKELRRRMYAKIHVIWTQLRPDLKKGTSEYKEGLYMLAEAELKKPRIASLTELTQSELRRLIEVLVHEQSQPPLYRDSANIVPFTPRSAPAASACDAKPGFVEHLATEHQRFAINRLLGYLGWSEFGRERFLEDRFRCKRVEMLLNKQAHSCIRILLNCAGSKYWKLQGKEKVSQTMIRAAIPTIKRQLGIR